jgi:hypothetical protein
MLVPPVEDMQVWELVSWDENIRAYVPDKMNGTLRLIDFVDELKPTHS